MGLCSRKENKGKKYQTWRSSSKAVSQDSRQQGRAASRRQALGEMKVKFGGEVRRVRRILALDSLRKHKKGV
jgi:hypothetical protein